MVKKLRLPDLTEKTGHVS